MTEGSRLESRSHEPWLDLLAKEQVIVSYSSLERLPAAIKMGPNPYFAMWMKPRKGSKLLRKGRASIKNQHYLITTTVLERKPIFNRPEAAEIVLSSLYWLEKQDRILLDAAVIMPDHLHFVAGLMQGSLAQLIHSLKSYTANKVNVLLNRHGPLWQPHYHDHAIRQEEDLNELALYTLNNPVRAGLVNNFHDYPFRYCRWDV